MDQALRGAAKSTGPIVETPYGRVRGVRDGMVQVFRGIPYAAPPMGPSRFRAPRPPAPWQGVRDAASFGRIAPQPFLSIPGLRARPMGED